MIKFILPVITGAIIGYITNWIAIKMLFRPHNEVRIFGIKVPFTPGVIPKEKERIAKSIGTMIDIHLLNNEVFREVLHSDDVKQRIKISIMNKIEEITDSGRDLGDVYALITGEDKLSAVEGAKDKIHKYAGPRLETFTLNLLRDISNETSARLVKDLLRKGSAKMLPDERHIIDVIPVKLMDFVEKYIYCNKLIIGSTLHDFLSKPATVKSFNDFITHILKNNKNKLINTLINPDFVTAKLMESLQGYVKDPANHDKISEILFDIIRKILEVKIKEVGGLLGKDNVADVLGEHGSTLLKSGIEDNASNFFKSEVFFSAVDKLIDMISEVKVSGMVETFDKDKVSCLFVDIYEKYLIDKIILAVESLDLEKIVEDQINTFDLKHLEELIVGLAKKELGAITKLGALLGALMGGLFTLFDKFI